MFKHHRIARALGVLIAGTTLAAYSGAAEPSATSALPQTKVSYVCQMATTPAKEYDKPGYCPTDHMELVQKKTLRVAVLVFNEAEIIDFTGPMEVFSAAGATIFTVAPTMEPILAGDSLRVKPDYDIDHAPEADVLVIPGGNQQSVTQDPKLMDWIRKRSQGPETLMSVCTGAFILGEAGLLENKSATVTASALTYFAKKYPSTLVVRNQRFVDAGKIITTGGLSAGIDGALHVVEREQGTIRAQDVARYLEYDWQPQRIATAGNSARLQYPSLASLFPTEVSWERTQDAGDANHWTILGKLGLPGTTVDAYLNDGASKIAAKGWVAGPIKRTPGVHPKIERNFTHLVGAQTWQMTLSLLSDGAHDNYRMTMALHKAKAASAHAASPDIRPVM